jgi:hypothetical protein
VSHLFSDRVGFIRTAVDSFNRLKVATPFTLFDNQMRYKEDGKFSNLTSGNATTNYKINESALDLVIGTNSGDKVYRESKRVFPYQPGKSLLIMNTFTFNQPKSNLRQRVGYFGSQNGVFLEQNGDELSFVLRSFVTGSVDDSRKINQSDWNYDTFDGRGPSGRILDVSKANILWFDIEWLGVGDVRCGFVVDGEPIVAHVFHNDNMNTTTYMTTSCLPIRYEIENTGNTTSGSTFKQICSTVISEGGYQGRSLNYTVGYDLVNLYDMASANVYYPIISIRLKQDRLDSIIIPDLVDLFTRTNNANFKYQLRLNPTLTGQSFSNVSVTSAAEWDKSATAVSGGIILNAGYFSVSKGGSVKFGSLEDFNLQIGRTMSNVSDVVTICMITDSAGADVGATLGWNELV